MNIGDYVYIYLFELEKSLISMNELRNDRFGTIIDKTIMECSIGEQVISYKIRLLYNNQVIEYKTNSLSTNIASLGELIEMIGRSAIQQEKKDKLIEQIDNVVKE